MLSLGGKNYKIIKACLYFLFMYSLSKLYFVPSFFIDNLGKQASMSIYNLEKIRVQAKITVAKCFPFF
jgi:hypothetical protein